MKYLKLFNEGSKFDDLKDNPAGYTIWGKVTIFKQQIEDLSYIINDIGGDVKLHCGMSNGSAKLSVSIEPRIMQYSGDIETVAISLDKSREWVNSLILNESYLEWIDRIEEIIQGSGYEIFTERGLHFSRVKNKVDKCFKFSYLIIKNLELEGIWLGTKFVPIRQAIEEEYESKHMTIPGKIKNGLKVLENQNKSVFLCQQTITILIYNIML